TLYGRGHEFVKGWYQATDGAPPDFYNSIHSAFMNNKPVHTARTGNGRIGLCVADVDDPRSGRNWDPKAYAETKLIAPLEPGKLYSVNYFVVLDKRAPYCTPIGAYLSDQPARNFTALNYIKETPQVEPKGIDTIANTGWQLVHGYYRARG